MLLGRVPLVGLLVASAACGGRAVVEANETTGTAPDAGAGSFEVHDPTGAEQARCSDELSRFVASATLIDQEYDGPCARDSDCQIASVKTRCLHACIAAARDVAVFSAALSNADECSPCPSPGAGDPCAGSVPVCDRGHCAARAQ